MTPVQKAAAVYQKEPCPRSFKEDLEAHLLDPNGIVISTSELFLMARPVLHYHPYYAVTDPHIRYANGDCWHLYLFSGSLMSAFKYAPYRLPYVSYERTNSLRVYNYDVIHRKCARFSSSFSTDLHLS